MINFTITKDPTKLYFNANTGCVRLSTIKAYPKLKQAQTEVNVRFAYSLIRCKPRDISLMVNYDVAGRGSRCKTFLFCKKKSSKAVIKQICNFHRPFDN